MNTAPFSPTVVFPGPSWSLKHTDPCTLGRTNAGCTYAVGGRQEGSWRIAAWGAQGPLLPSASRQPRLSPQLPALLKLTPHGLAEPSPAWHGGHLSSPEPCPGPGAETPGERGWPHL